MKQFMKQCFFFFFLALPFLAFALDSSVDPTPYMPGGEAASALQALINSLAGLKGAGALAIAAFVIQLLMKIMNSKLGEHAGKYKLVVLYSLSIVGGLLSLTLAGIPLGAALVHSQTLAAFQVFANQVYKQFVQKKNE